jgi:hypothetical protein
LKGELSGRRGEFGCGFSWEAFDSGCPYHAPGHRLNLAIDAAFVPVYNGKNEGTADRKAATVSVGGVLEVLTFILCQG